MAAAWACVARTDEIDVGPPFHTVEIGPVTLLLTRLPDGEVVAFAASCPHQGQPLAQGLLTADGCIECRFHFYAYDPRTGENVFPGDDADVRLPVYETREADGWVWVGPRRPPPS